MTTHASRVGALTPLSQNYVPGCWRDQLTMARRCAVLNIRLNFVECGQGGAARKEFGVRIRYDRERERGGTNRHVSSTISAKAA